MISYISDAGMFYLEQIERRVSLNEVKEVPAKMLYELAAEIRRLNKTILVKDTEVSTLNVTISKMKDNNYNEMLKLQAAIGRLNMANQLREAADSYGKLEVYKG